MERDTVIRECIAKLHEIRCRDHGVFFALESLLAADPEDRTTEKSSVVGAHWSDCAVNSEPAYPAGPCDCGGFSEPEPESWMLAQTIEEPEADQERAAIVSWLRDHVAVIRSQISTVEGLERRDAAAAIAAIVNVAAFIEQRAHLTNTNHHNEG